MKPLYFAPLNHFSNALFRHFLLKRAADFVFSELIMIDRVESELLKEKLLVYGDDLSKTIFQIGARNKEEVIEGVKLIKSTHKDVVEINLNAGCPQSTMQKNLVCGGLLFDKNVFFEVSNTLSLECKKANCLASVKLRLGINPEFIDILDYVKLLVRAGISKIYIHARTLRYNYTKPAMYQHFINLKKSFPNVTFIFNGDVDSYTRYKTLVDMGADGVMIGRTALSNQDIFTQIKNKQSVKIDSYDPFLNDPEIDFSSGFAKPSKRKISVLLEFISLAKNHDLSLSLTKKHLLHCTKGLGGHGVLAKNIREAKDFNLLSKIVNSL